MTTTTTTSTTTAADINLKGARAFINGHYYVATWKGGAAVNWYDAQNSASRETTLIGTTGYLATVYSHAENEFIFTQSNRANNNDINLNYDAFLGGSLYGEVSGSSPGNFYWQYDPYTDANGIKFWNGHSGGSAVTGMYTNWYTANHEPNDANSNEDFVVMWSGSKGTSQWNDAPVTYAKGYITEWGVSGSSQYILGFDTAAPVNAHEASADNAANYGSVKITFNNKYVPGNYVYDKPLIAIPLTFGGSAVHNQDYTVGVKAEAGQGSTYVQHALASFSSATTNPFGLSRLTTIEGTVTAGIVQPILVDIDNDKDLDLVTGTYGGSTDLFLNTGSATAPQFAGASYFGLPDFLSYSSPSLVDIDKDGDFDAFIGTGDGKTTFFKNTGSATSVAFSQTSSSNFGLTDVGDYAAPTLVDIDGDQDLDAFIGNYAGDVVFYRNTGTQFSPHFSAPTVNAFGLGGYGTGKWVAPRFFDIDNDSDSDLFIGHGDGTTLFFRNTGTASTASFANSEIVYGQTNLGLVTSNYGDPLAPTFGDLDGDGDLDAIIGNYAGDFLYQRNDSKDILYVKPSGSTYDDQINSVTLQIKPINNATRQVPRDVTITLGSDVGVKLAGDSSTYHIYSLDSSTAHSFGSSSTQQLWLIDDEPTLSLGQGLKQSIYTNYVASTTDNLDSTTAATTLFDVNGINETDGTGGTFTALGLNDNFGIRWEGYIRISQTGSYLFNVSTDDGVKLLLKINNSTGASLGTITHWNAGPNPPAISASLNAGDVVWLQMDYFENKGAAVAQLNWQPPGSTTYQVIPGSALFLSEAAARGSVVEPTSGEATGPGFTIYANKSPASDLNLNVGFSTTNGTTTINSGNAQRDANSQSIGHISSDDYAIYTDSATTTGKLGPNPQSLPTWSANSSDTFNLYYKILSDSWAEADEAITMTLSAGTGYGLASGTMTTTLHDQPLTLSIEEVHNPNEGDAGWVIIRSRINGVLTNNPIQGGLHVKYQITGGGTAARDTDYVAPKATINTDPTTYSAEDLIYLPYGASEAKLYIAALADAIREGNETITLQLLTRDEITVGTNPFTYQHYLVDGSKASATVTINDSTAWTPGVAITPPNRTGMATIRASVNSNNQQQASVDVHLLSQPKADVTVALGSTSGTLSASTITFNSSNWSTPHSVTITGLSDSANTTLSATTSSTGDSFYSGKTASQTIIPFGSTTDLPLTLWEGGPEQVFTPTVTVTAVDGTEGATNEFGFTLNLDAPRVDSDLEVFFTLAAGSGFQLSGNDADVTTSTAQRSYNPLLLTGGSAYADLGSLATVGTGGVFSAEAWVRPDGTSTANTAVLEFSDASGANEIMLGFVAGSLRPMLTLANSSSTSIGTISGSNALVAGQWNHLAFSIDGNHTANLYLNGSLVASTLLSAVPLSASRSRNWVGQSSQSSSGFLNGAVRDVRVWNSSRSAEQIQASMLSSNASGSNLIGAWSFSNSSANNPPQGLRQTVYPQFVGTPSNTLPDSSTAGPVLTDTNGINETDNVPGGTFTSIGLADEFGIRWEGYIRIPQSGSYKFQTISDDGIRLTLKQNNTNGASLAAISNSIPYSINNWTPHGATINTSSSVSLNAGDVVWMQLDYFENGGSAKTELQWIRTPSGGSAITEDIPASAFYLTQAGAAAGASPNAVTGGSAAALLGSARFEATPTYGIVIPVGGNSAVVQFSAIDDSSAEATESISLNLKGSGRYTTTPNYISTANLDDNDTAGLVFSLFNADKSTWTVATSATTNEGDATSTPPSHTTMGVTLATKPSTDVTVTLNPISYASAELQVSSSKTLTFTPANWNQQQQLILQGVDDLDDDRDKTMSLRFTVASADPEYNGLEPTLQVTNVDNDAVNDSSKGANVNGGGPLVSISSPTPASLVEGSTSTSSFVVTLRDKSSQDTVVYFDLDRKVGNALDNDVLIQPDAGSSMMSGLTLLGLLKGGQLFTQVDNDGIKETKATFAAKNLSGAFTSTWTGWLRIDQDGSYSFQTQMTGGSLSLYVIDQAHSIISGTTVNGNSGSLNLTGGTFVPIRLEFTASGSTTVDPSISLYWTRPASNGDSVQELLPASQLQRVQGRHVVIPAGATSGGFNVSVVNDNVSEGVAGVSTQENLVLVMLDPQPIEVKVTDWRGTAQAAQLTLDISSSSNREESYTLAAGTVLKLMGDPTVASTIRAKYTLSQAVTLHRDLTTLTSGLLTDPSGASYTGAMADLLTLVSTQDATGSYNAIDTSVSIQAISNWQPTNFSASSVGAFGLPISQGGYASPTFVDIDADGDQDAFIGNNGSILFYRNTGSASSAAFSTFSQGAFGLPGGAGGLGYVQAISFVDIDGDGDQDAFIGGNSGTIQFFKNTGTKSVAAFAGSANAFGLTPIVGASITAFADIDHDGDFDAFIGNQDGNVLFFRNTGSISSPQFASASTNPFGITKVNGDAAPAFVDIDRDGDLDLFIGKDPSGTSSDLTYFRNTGNASSPAFASAVTNAFGLPHTDLRMARPAFVDINADGNSDVFIGYNNGSTYFFKGNSSVDLALQPTNRSSVTLPVGTVLSYRTPADSGGTQNLNLTLQSALTLQAPSSGAATGTVHTASVAVSNESGSTTVAAIQGSSALVQVSPALQLTLLDNDTPGIFISSDAAGSTAVSTSVVALTEPGASTDRWVRLNSQPTETVTVYLQSSDLTEVLLLPSSGGTAVSRLALTFTVEDWNVPKKFTLQPQNDHLIDGPVSLTIKTSANSSDPFYNSISGASLSVSVADDDTAGLTRNLVTSTLSQGSNGFLNLQLNAQPAADVTVTLTPLDTQFTVNERGVGMAETIIFTPDNWSVQHKVDLKVVNDTAVEDITHSQLKLSTSSSDLNFHGLTVTPVSIDIVDNDLPTASIQLVKNSTEEAAPGFFRIKLSAPAPNSSGSDGVVVNYNINSLTLDSGLGYGSSPSPSSTLGKIVQVPKASGQVRIAPGSDFSDAFVVPIDDFYPDSPDKQFSVTLGTGTGYLINSADSSSSATISILNNDKAGVGIITTGSRASATEGDSSANGGQFLVVLLAQPAVGATVTVTLTENVVGASRQLGTSADSYSQVLTFNANNWSIPQPAYVYAYNDKKIAVQNVTGSQFEQEDSSRHNTGYQTAQIAYRFDSTDPNYNSASHANDSSHFTRSTLQTVDIMDKTLSIDTDIAVNNSLILMQDGIETLSLPMVGVLDGKVGSVFRGFLQQLVNGINISGTPAPNQLKKIIEDNIPPFNGAKSVVTLSMDGDNTRVQVNFSGQEILYSLPLAKDLGTPALGIQTEGKFDAGFDYNAQLTLVFDKDNNIHLDTSPANTFVSSSYNVGLSDDFSVSGGLGLLQLTGTNKVSTNPHIGSHATGVDIDFAVDLSNLLGSGGDGKLDYQELTGSSTSQKHLFDYNFNTSASKATLSLGVVANDRQNASLPKISFDLATNYALFDYANPVAATTLGNDKPIYFSNIKLDLGSYISNSIKKYVDMINPYLKPIYPIVNALDADLHVLTTLGIADRFDVDKDKKVTILEVAQTLSGYLGSGQTRLKEEILTTIDYINKLTAMVDFVKELANSNSVGNDFVINLGSYATPSLFSASSDPSRSTQNIIVTNGDTSQLNSSTKDQANAGGSDSSGNSSGQLMDYMQYMRTLGFVIDIIDDPINVIKLLLNQDASIFTWELPTPELSLDVEEDFPIVEDIVDGLFEGNVGLTADLAFGFDTHGLTRWRDSGFKHSDAYKVLEGFYIVDQHDGVKDLPEFSFTAGVAAGLGLIAGIVRGDIIGGIVGNAYLNLLDQPDSKGVIDYKIRPSDFLGSASHLQSMFDLSGDLSVYLEARVDLGVDLGFTSFWTTVWKDELATLNIFTFDIGDGHASFNVSGTLSNGYIEGATIFFDANYNNRIDASEPSSISTGAANFSLFLEPRSHDDNQDGTINDNEGHLVAYGGTDTSTNQALKVPLLAPYGPMITPLTTLFILGVEQEVDDTMVKNWINEAFQLRGFDFFHLDPVVILKGQEAGVIGGTSSQMAYLAHAKLFFALDQLLTTLQSIEPLLLQNDLQKQVTLMGHVAKALFQLPPTLPINQALATSLREGTESWIESFSPQLSDRDVTIVRDVARHASVTSQEFGRRQDQVAASFRDSDGATFLAGINAVKSDGYGYFRSAMPDLTVDIQSFTTAPEFLDALHNRLVATELTYATPGGVDVSGTGITSDTASGIYTAGSVISILVPFTEVVTVTGTPTLLLQLGSTMRSAVYSEGSGSTILSFTYTVEAGDVSADLDYASSFALELNGGTIKDGFGDNATLTLPTPGGTGSLAANADLVIDALAPTLSGSNPADGAIGVLEAANIQLTFSEAVQAGTGSIQLLRADGSTVESFDVASGAGSAGGSLTISGSGVSLDPFASLLSNTAYSLTISPTALTDAAGNAFAGISDPTSFNFSTGDSIAPSISAVSSINADGTYGTGARITLSLRFSEAVTATGNGGLPSLLLETGAIDRSAIYSSGSGTDTLTFAYTVQAGDTSADLDIAATNALALNGSTITDGAGNNATLSLPTPGAPGSLAANAALVIRGTIPQSLSISTGTPAVSEGASISVALSSEGLAAGAPIYWSFAGAGITAADFSPSGLSGSLNLGSDLRAAFSRSISTDGISEGDEQLTLSFFSDANRTVSLGQAMFTLRDLVPVGVAGATDGRDQITGSSADELISGVPVGSVLNGRGSYDNFTGNGGNDIFILGTASTVYYNDGKSNTTGAADLAAITDFNVGDLIQLKGSAADYRLSSGALSGSSGSFIHWRAAAGAGSSDETIGFVQGLTPAGLTLSNSSQFIYL